MNNPTDTVIKPGAGRIEVSSASPMVSNSMGESVVTITVNAPSDFLRPLKQFAKTHRTQGIGKKSQEVLTVRHSLERLFLFEKRLAEFCRFRVRYYQYETRTSANDHWEFATLKLAGFLLPKESRDEWIGDLRESLEELRVEGYPRWIGAVIAFLKVCVLGIALVRIKITDLLPAKKPGS